MPFKTVLFQHMIKTKTIRIIDALADMTSHLFLLQPLKAQVIVFPSCQPLGGERSKHALLVWAVSCSRVGL